MSVSARDKVDIGQTLLDTCLLCCSDFFEKVVKTISKNEKMALVIIKKELHVYFTNFVFNPLRLPMVHRPNK